MSDHLTAGDRIGAARAQLIDVGWTLADITRERPPVTLAGRPINWLEVLTIGARRTAEAAIAFAESRIVDGVILCADAKMLFAISTGMALHDRARGAR